jgi:hypothetical protein
VIVKSASMKAYPAIFVESPTIGLIGKESAV